MDNPKSQLADKLKTANNVLVTVSRDPSVDQLAACIGLTLLLNKLSKHTAAVFSGQVPSTLEFLKPEETLEKNTDSLRDFIIALDKSKADKLRYKVEDNVVRIFITPYRTSISQDDLEFSQGDFNVDLVIALGVGKQEDLDAAITAHGRILHDATVASINTTGEGGLGSINWHDLQASSLSELVTELGQTMGNDLLDGQIATALLTGIVAETDRFSNDKTSSQTMSASAALMAAGANQQLVATKLAQPSSATSKKLSNNSGNHSSTSKTNDGSLNIDHNDQVDDGNSTETKIVEPVLELPTPQVSTSNGEVIDPAAPFADNASPGVSAGSKLVTEPPALGGTLTANTQVESLDPAVDPLGLPTEEPPQLLDRDMSAPAPTVTALIPGSSATPMAPEAVLLSGSEASATSSGATASTPLPVASNDDQYTLSELEASVHSPHLEPGHLNTARDEVSRALNNGATSEPPPPIQALNAQPLGDVLHTSVSPASAANALSNNDTPSVDSGAPPPVPPPIPFQFGGADGPPV